MKKIYAIYLLLALVMLTAACQKAKPVAKIQSKNTKISTQETYISTELKNLNTQVEKFPQSQFVYMSRLEYYCKENDLYNAKTDYEYIYSLDSTTELFYKAQSCILLYQNQPKEAIYLLKTTIENKYPKSQILNLYLGKIYYLATEYELSFEYINTALRENKNNPEGYFLKGMNYKELNRKKEAIGSFQTCIEIDPNYFNAYIQLAIINTPTDPKRALEYYNSALVASPNNKEALFLRAFLYQGEKNYELALKDYNLILKESNNFFGARYNKALILKELMFYTTALDEVNKAIKILPNDENAIKLKTELEDLI